MGPTLIVRYSFLSSTWLYLHLSPNGQKPLAKFQQVFFSLSSRRPVVGKLAGVAESAEAILKVPAQPPLLLRLGADARDRGGGRGSAGRRHIWQVERIRNLATESAIVLQRRDAAAMVSRSLPPPLPAPPARALCPSPSPLLICLSHSLEFYGCWLAGTSGARGDM